MSLAIRKHLQRSLARVPAAVVMLGLWLGLSLFAASPDLHHLIHPDSQHVSHECILTLLANGLVTGADLTDLEIVRPEPTDYSPTRCLQVASQPSDIRLARGRAPPAFLAPQKTPC